MATDQATLYLFSSNIRELYITDILDILAAPRGSRRSFRYKRQYVESALRDSWKHNGLENAQVVVLFSIQHVANFYDPVYIPIRRAWVSRTWVEGEVYLVDFNLDEHLTVAGTEGEATKPKELARYVKQWTEAAEAQLDGTPRSEISASLGPPSPNLGLQMLEGVQAFERSVAYLTPTLHSPPRIYYRWVRCSKSVDRDDPRADISLDQGVLKLDAATSYTVEIAHRQLDTPPANAAISIRCGPGLVVAGHDTVELRSRYDVFPVALNVAPTEGPVPSWLSIQASDAKMGPEIFVPISIRPTAGQAVALPVGLLGGGSAALLAASGTAWDTRTRVFVAIVGVLTAGGASWYRARRGLR